VAKVVWAIIAVCLDANNIPSSIDNCWLCCEKWLPGGKKFHTFGIVTICWAIWKTRNKMCFEGKVVKDPTSIVCYACALMSYWAGLYTGDDKDALIAGVNCMIEIAMKLLGKK
jgi:hypothetical protein